METISAIRFNFTRKGDLRAELTFVGQDGVRNYIRIANAADTIKAAVASGADIRGYDRTIELKSEAALAANGGKPTVVVAEYATAPVRMLLTFLGEYVEVDLTSVKLAGATQADAAMVKGLVAGVVRVPVAARATKPAAAGDDNDLA